MPKDDDASRTRRSNGEGTKPRERKDGRWQIDLRISQTTTGEPIRKSFIAATRATVVAKAQTYRNSLAKGLVTDPTRTTLEAWVRHWLENIAAPRVRQRTLTTYRQYMQKWVFDSREGRVPLEKLAPMHLDRVYGRMRAAKKSETTVLQVHRILSKSLKDATMRGMLGANPAARVTAPRPAQHDAVVLTPTKARELIAAAKEDSVHGPSWTVALALGLRQGERLGLCWDDVDLEAGTVSIRQTLARLPWRHGCEEVEAGGKPCGKRAASCPHRYGGYRMLPTKSAAGRRTIPLPAPLVHALREQLALQQRWKIEEGTRWRGFIDEHDTTWNLVFSRRDGSPIDPATDRSDWAKFTRANGIPKMRVHDARHTAATVLLSLGVAPRVVMDMMGWSAASMLTRYQHVMDEMRTDAATRVAGALWADEEPAEDPQPPAPEPAETPAAKTNVIDFEAMRRRRGA